MRLLTRSARRFQVPGLDRQDRFPLPDPREARRRGHGVVYRARDIHLQRNAALRLLSPDDPNIYEIAEADEGRMFIALAHYEGETLEQLIEGLIEVIRSNTCPDRNIFRRLPGAHLVRQKNRAVVRHGKLYEDYFGEHLQA